MSDPLMVFDPEVYGEPVLDSVMIDPLVYGEMADGGTLFTLDAVLRAEQAGSFTANAILRASQTGSFTLDAWVASYFTIDAILRIGRSASLTADAILRASQSGSFTLDAVLLANFTLDAILRIERAGSLTANAILRQALVRSLTADAVLKKTQALTFTADAVLKKTRAFTFTANAIRRKTQTSSRNFNAVLRKTQTGSWTIDAELAYHRVGSFPADAIIHKEQVRSLVLRATIKNNEAEVAASTGVTQVHIRVDGADITDDVIFSDATFTTLVNGQTGSFRFRVKDTTRTRSFTTGAEVTLDIDGIRRFGGYLMNPTRTYFFPVEDTSDITKVARVLTFSGVDYNTLFQKRVVYDKARPANVALRSWPEDTPDDEIIKYVFDNYTDLFDDGFTTDRVEHVGFPNPDKKGTVGSGSLYFGDLMREVNRLIGAVWYLSPDKDLTWADVDTANASKSLSDNPAGGSQIGYRNLSIEENGTKLANDALVWGAAQGVADLKFGRNTNATSIAAHGRWQYGEFTTQLYKQASVNLRAATVVNGTPQSKRGGKDDRVSWMASTYDTAFVIGQKVSIESEVYGLSDVLPIRRMTITFPTKTNPKFDMILSHEVDEPWNTFEFMFPSTDFDIRVRIPPVDIPDIEILDPTIPACWLSPPTYLDDFNRAFLTDPVGPYEFSDVGCTSHGGYPWRGGNYSSIYPEGEGYSTAALNGGLDLHLAQGNGTADSYNYVGPNAGSWIETTLGTGLFVSLPIDGKNYRIEFTLLLTQGGDFDHDPPNNDYINSAHNQNRSYFGLALYRHPGPYVAAGTANSAPNFDDAVWVELWDNAGSYHVGVPFGCYAFLNDSLSANPADMTANRVGGQGSFGSGIGCVLIRDGDNVQLTVGALTLNTTVPTDFDNGVLVDVEPGSTYTTMELTWSFDNEALDWGPALRPNAEGYTWFGLHGDNSQYRARISELRVITAEGNCIDVPPHNADPVLNGPCA